MTKMAYPIYWTGIVGQMSYYKTPAEEGEIAARQDNEMNNYQDFATSVCRESDNHPWRVYVDFGVDLVSDEEWLPDCYRFDATREEMKKAIIMFAPYCCEHYLAEIADSFAYAMGLNAEL